MIASLRSLFSILTDNAVICMVLALPLIANSSCSLIKHLGIVPEPQLHFILPSHSSAF